MITGRILGLVIGYVFGLFQTGYFYGKAHHIDIRQHGSGNSGMTNVLRVLGWKAGVIVCLGDLFKAVAAMALVWFLFRDRFPDAVRMLELYAGVGATLGHNFPFYLKFKGGKGIACSIGIIFSFDFRMVPICAILFFVPVIPTGFMSLGSLGIISGFLIQTVVFGQLGLLHMGALFLPETYVLAAVIAGLAFWQHRENIKRLSNGTENKFRPAKSGGSDREQ